MVLAREIAEFHQSVLYGVMPVGSAQAPTFSKFHPGPKPHPQVHSSFFTLQKKFREEY
jgi:hypothetical protein